MTAAIDVEAGPVAKEHAGTAAVRQMCKRSSGQFQHSVRNRYDCVGCFVEQNRNTCVLGFDTKQGPTPVGVLRHDATAPLTDGWR